MNPPQFPGMNPYLEGYLWRDVHQSLMLMMRELLLPKIVPQYVAHIEPYVVRDNLPEADMGMIYPDLAVLKKYEAEEPVVMYPDQGFSPPDFTVPFASHVPVRIPRLVIKNREDMRVVTVVEILSPVNKKQPGLHKYLKKRRLLHQKGVHFVEIDLLRRGTRTLNHPRLAENDYAVQLLRAGAAQSEVWCISLHSPLPVIPIPLDAPDADVPLNIQAALNLATERGMYHLSIDYQVEPPLPALKDEHKTWLKSILSH
ncbi:MAG: DUF4058 family protein [Saprospiraceae bacterium]